MNWGLYIISYIGVVLIFWFVLGLAFIGIQAFIRAFIRAAMYLSTNRKTGAFCMLEMALYRTSGLFVPDTFSNSATSNISTHQIFLRTV